MYSPSAEKVKPGDARWCTRASSACILAASAYRSAGSTARERITTSSSPEGRPPTRDEGGAIVTLRIFSTTWASDSPSKGWTPVSALYRTSPRLKRSARWSIALARTCSGAMYISLPRIVPASVLMILSRALATPKSRIFTSPAKETWTFCGLMSRWMIFIRRPRESRAPWAAYRPLHTSIATCTAKSQPKGRPRSVARRRSWDRLRPDTYSIAR